MHARELIELAAVVASHGAVLIRGPARLDCVGLERYWNASKCRLDRWSYRLKQWSAEASLTDGNPARASWPSIRGVLEEVLTGEVLTRVWTAVVSAHDQHHRTDEAEPVVRSVFLGHQESRHRVLSLMVRGPGIGVEHAMTLDHLRRRTDRWCDMLVGRLAAQYPVSQFAVDPARAKDFAEDFHDQAALPGGRHVWSVVQVSLRAAFRQDLAPVSPNADLNARIASGIFACFPPETFDSTGVLRSLWGVRLDDAANDAQGLLDDLLGNDGPASPEHRTGSQPPAPGNRLRRFGSK